MPNINEIQEFFFAAMQQAYGVGDTPMITIPELPGSKAVEIYSPDKKFRFLDCIVIGREISFGFTIIWENVNFSGDFVPVWRIQSHGWWNEEIDIWEMKKDLLKIYSQEVFPSQGFDSFSGYKKVFGPNKEELWYQYFVGSILFNP